MPTPEGRKPPKRPASLVGGDELPAPPLAQPHEVEDAPVLVTTGKGWCAEEVRNL